MRETEKIIERAKNNKLPELIQTEDIRSIIHSHSNWSDGSNTLEEMADECIKRGFEYLVISDHSQSAFYANGLKEDRIIAQQKQIDELNARFALQPSSRLERDSGGQAFKIFKSIESDILYDGKLDYPDHILGTRLGDCFCS